MAKGTPLGYESSVVADDAGWARWKPRAGHVAPGEGECPTCGASHDPSDEDGLLMALQCPTCKEPGCDECIPGGRGCECTSCEDGGW